MTSNTIAEHETLLGERLKALRLNQNLDQKTLAARAGLSVGALKNLENGAGSTTRTLLSVLRALGREEWLSTVAPIATINPLNMPRAAQQRQRASRKSSKCLIDDQD
ncbi:MAG: helix-turn-helix transcriptional regulator [Comamonadaceae bacterium]